ncbi:cytochrome P450 [Thermobispora bispora]|uniref:cytochrome P450 n=1 Tax=Thermobispora bispora TaxID=2006 RepID=UPI00197F404E|nr:cytochrome P450 [Thermobispora bispora]MBO2474887.1 cytochrome P450 [Actinomycetales bacterium]MBX6168118.1 cytochrome P450 [Thermobispora bispora]MDI9582105.1 cytochrome P450 [Thermobispora sp.]QSI49519.1 cytochrome P450 [Thermobispora bispora]
MSVETAVQPAKKVRTIPFYRLLVKNLHDPIAAFEEVGRIVKGELVRLNMGPFKPFLVTYPDHVQHVLRLNQPNYVREGMFWDPIKPMIGDGILSDGPNWAESRRLLQPLFTAKYVDSLTDEMSRIISEQIDSRIRPGEPFDIAKKTAEIVQTIVVRLFFGDKISKEDIARLIPAYETGVTATAPRIVLPFVPQSIPLPGDRAFRNCVKTIDEVIYPRIHAARAELDESKNVVSAICRARRDDIGPEGDRRIRDDVVGMHGASTETSATALTWMWVALHAYPHVAERVYAEIDEVVGAGPVQPSHLPDLRYTEMFLHELLRLYPSGWILPRLAKETDVIDGVTIPAGSTVVLSPYLTHRLEEFWERPLEFDPERFAPGKEHGRHRWAYIPFGGGPHQCLGKYLFFIEAKLLLAGILSRYRPILHAKGEVKKRFASSLRPDKGLQMTLVERTRA